MKKVFFLFIVLFPLLLCNAQTPLWQGKGRIIIGCDGNEHDNDDWSATALSLALLASQQMQDKLAVYVYSDHIWGSNHSQPVTNGLTQYEQMGQSALGGQKWFGFNKTNFVCAADNPEVAYNAVCKEINKSSASNPLIIIEAGPMQVTGEAISRANKGKLKYVTLITHSNWNNNHANKPDSWEKHTGWTFDQIKEQFSAPEKGGLTCVQIHDQNGGRDYLGLRTNKSEFDWLKTSVDKEKPPYYRKGSWDWLYSRLQIYIDCVGGEIFDASDAGMVVYLLTGVEKTNPGLVRQLMEKKTSVGKDIESARAKNLSGQIIYDKKIPQVQFAVEEIEKAEKVANRQFSTPDTDVIINFQIDNSLSKEEYVIRRDGKSIFVKGGDANGLMYAGLELAEAIQNGEKLTTIENSLGKPYMPYRGIKFNFPLDARTPSYDDTGDAAQNNIPVMWDFDFWKNYLDNMARYRYNLLTLWNLHPYPSMIRAPGFEDVALDDVCVYTNPITSSISRDWDGEDIQNPGNLKVVKKLTMDEKIAFWRKVFQYAENRGIGIFMFHWNVYANGAGGKYGITSDQHNPVTINYTRESVKQFLLTYPNIKGIGVTAGEHVDVKEKGKSSIVNWIWLTFGQGIKEAQAINPTVDPVFIFRQHETSLDTIASVFKDYGKPIDTEFKYSRARMFSTTTPPWFDKIYRKTVEEHGVKIWMNMRNDDIFNFRWGDPVYASEYIKNMPRELMAGYFWGPDGYVYGRDFNSKNADKLPKYEIDKQWYLFMIFGRAGYNPNLPETFYINRIKARFPGVDAKKLYDTWRYTSDVISWLEKIHFRQNDAEFLAEGCFDMTRFHNIDMFIRVPCLPLQNVSSIGDFIVNGNAKGEMTPFDVADKLDMASQNLLQGTAGIKPVNNMELEQTLGDLTALGYLAKYYALKIRAATNLGFFKLNGAEENKTAAVNL